MNKNERLVFAGILLIIAILTTVDIYNDYFEGVALWHIFVESFAAITAIMGILYLVRDYFRLQHSLKEERELSGELQQEAHKWKQVSQTYLEGLSAEIDKQLDRWNLTSAEKEIAFLLLKGLSIKEIARIRDTSEKTVRTQASAVYSKSGLSGRSELSAFFLEDLLPPGRESY